VVLLNAGAGLFVAGLVEEVRAGVELAGELLDSGRVREQVERIREVSSALRHEQSGAAAS
jgi:anthranilate phosphoribosyltransferase